MSTGGRRLIAATLMAMSGVLAACGSTATSSATSPPAAGTTSTTSQATTPGARTATPAVPDVRALDPFLFPEQDSPLAQANSMLKAAWAPYNITVIPSRHTLETMQTPRKVANLTVGAIDDATAQSYLNAEYRGNTFVAWAEKNVQLGFMNALLGDLYQTAPSYVAVKEGKAVSDPACDLYPVNPAVVVLDQQTTDYLTRTRAFKLQGKFAIVQTLQGPCDVTYASPPPGATPLGSLSAGGETDVLAGHLVHDPVLGDLWFADGAYACGKPGSPTTICLAART